MTLPTVYATINFSTGPAFAQTAIIGSAVYGTNVFGDSAGVIVDVSNQVNYIKTFRGRSSLADQFQTGTLTMRIVDQNGKVLCLLGPTGQIRLHRSQNQRG